jgi:exonuclease VII small subunit
MIPQYSGLSRRLISAVLYSVWLAAPPAAAADPPRPTPRPGSLAAYAAKITLDRSALGDGVDHLILTNDSVAGIAAGGSITLGSLTPAGGKRSNVSGTANDSERSRWQAAHRKQRQVIATLERQRAKLEIEIDQLEDLSLTAKVMARLDRAESKLRHLDEEIARQREALARIVRDARRHGAEPGWFR